MPIPLRIDSLLYSYEQFVLVLYENAGQLGSWAVAPDTNLSEDTA